MKRLMMFIAKVGKLWPCQRNYFCAFASHLNLAVYCCSHLLLRSVFVHCVVDRAC